MVAEEQYNDKPTFTRSQLQALRIREPVAAAYIQYLEEEILALQQVADIVTAEDISDDEYEDVADWRDEDLYGDEEPSYRDYEEEDH